MWCENNSNNASLHDFDEDSTKCAGKRLNIRSKIWSRFPMGLYTKNKHAGECQQ
jgi:hypothetical protein